ncbi:MAG: hypothetical protein LBQ60_18355 [Bacteroidales bacterium]|jgi:hypothetical protein|nr:hypothetical protein [Bacteroidales bacterium]
MKKGYFLFLLWGVSFSEIAFSKICHETDEEGLHVFLHQLSIETGNMDPEVSEMAISDAFGWHLLEEWVGKLGTSQLYNPSDDLLEYAQIIGMLILFGFVLVVIVDSFFNKFE